MAAIVVVPVAALAFSLRQPARYQGSAQVLLSQQDLGSQLTGAPNYTNDPADRQAQTQANLARVPQVALGAIQALHAKLTTAEFLGASSVGAAANADILTFDVTNHNPRLAQLLATAYARSYVRYRLATDTAPIRTALHEVEAQIAKVPAQGQLYTSLQENATKLRTLAALKTANASVVQASAAAVQTAPKTTRNVVLGVALGLFLGVGLAFLREALDTRIRTAEGIGEQLHLPLLARISAPPRKLRAANRLVMLQDPKAVEAEAFRMLRTNIEFAALGKEARTIMVTSAVEEEGKSTTIANLAVALARAGQHVALVDLDLRRPYLDRFFDLREHAGLTQVVIGAVPLESAVARIPITGEESPLLRNNNGHRNGSRGTSAVLDVLASGPLPPDPGEFVGAARLTEILDHLGRVYDVVLIDAPPLFHVGDAATLSSKVDAVLVVTRMDRVRRPMLTELKRRLDMMPAHKLGFIVTGAEAEESYGYGAGYGYYYARPYEREKPKAGGRT